MSITSSQGGEDVEVDETRFSEELIGGCEHRWSRPGGGFMGAYSCDELEILQDTRGSDILRGNERE
jgi:hypothetical protein